MNGPARRFTDKADLDPTSVMSLAPAHPAMVGNRTLFPSTVVTVTKTEPKRLLVSGRENRKLGDVVAKGKFKGYALYGLSLEERAARQAALSAAQSTPEALARTAEHNRRRWAKPEEHAKLSEQNRRRWADPANRAKYGLMSARIHGSPEARARSSAARKREWADPQQRAKRVAALNNSVKQTPEYRAYYSAMLRARWQDPVWRAKWTEANKRKNDRVRGKKMTPEQIAARKAARERNAQREGAPA